MNQPAFDFSNTSRAAMESIPASILRGKVLEAFKRRGEMTADEAAEEVRCTVLAIRPRVSELKADGKLRDTGTRRPNRSGRSAAVMRLVA